MTQAMNALLDENQGAEKGANQQAQHAVDFDEIKKLDYLNSREAAAYCRRSRSTMEKYRHFGGGPTFIRVSARAVLYRKVDLDAWLESKMHGSTSEYVAGGV